MEFFERLRERAKHKIKSYILHKYPDPTNLMYTMSANFILRTIDFTIEALKEMMVGEPMPRTLRELRTRIPGLDRTLTLGAVFLEDGADGEEVVVMVFKW